MNLAFLINKYIYIILIIILIPLFLIIFFNYCKYKKIEKKQNEFIHNLIACAICDSKYKINEFEVIRKIDKELNNESIK